MKKATYILTALWFVLMISLRLILTIHDKLVPGDKCCLGGYINPTYMYIDLAATTVTVIGFFIVLLLLIVTAIFERVKRTQKLKKSS